MYQIVTTLAITCPSYN